MIKKSFWTSLASAAYAIQSLATNKLFSLYFGPQGVTLLAHFQNIIAIFTTIPNDGVNRGVIRFLSNKQLETPKWNGYFSGAVLLNLSTFVFWIITMAFFYTSYHNDFPPQLFEPLPILLIISAILLHFASLFVINLIMANGEIKTFAIFSIINNMLGIGLVVIGLQKDIITALVCLCFSPSIILIFSSLYYLKLNKDRFENFTIVFDKKALKQLGEFILTAVSAGVLARTVDFFVRSYLIGKFDLYDTGLWQGAVKISDGYSTVFSAAFGSLFFVKISSMIEDKKALSAFVKQSILYIFLITFVGLGCVWFFKSEFLVLLYSPDFEKAERFMDLQLLGDLFKFPSWILGFLLMSQLKTAQFIYAQIASSVIYCLLVALLVPLLGIDGLPWAHCIRYFLYLVIMFLLTRKVFV